MPFGDQHRSNQEKAICHGGRLEADTTEVRRKRWHRWLQGQVRYLCFGQNLLRYSLGFPPISLRLPAIESGRPVER